jgi:phage tail protein X
MRKSGRWRCQAISTTVSVVRAIQHYCEGLADYGPAFAADREFLLAVIKWEDVSSVDKLIPEELDFDRTEDCLR